MEDFFAALERPPQPETPLGIYFHIPFCRKRCHFCYFRVYTDKDSAAIKGYLDAALKELAMYARQPLIGGRKPNFVYFGGGTPSYLSANQLKHLTDGMKALLPWDEVEEVTFEGEPGTLTDHKLKAIRDLGVTRLSLGVENFDDHILEINGRAHRAKEIYRAYGYAREIGFPQINIDLIAGMVEETEENWRECIRKTIELSPDSVTIYQMEMPYNTTIYKEMKAEGKLVAPVADWERNALGGLAFASWKRRLHRRQRLHRGEGQNENEIHLSRRIWAGADLLALGVASFGHIGGTHYQNHHDFDPYVGAVNAGELPVFRALTPTDDERMIREFILQLKLGSVSAEYFAKNSAWIRANVCRAALAHSRLGLLRERGDRMMLKREGLLQVDRLLHDFFLPQHRNARYT